MDSGLCPLAAGDGFREAKLDCSMCSMISFHVRFPWHQASTDQKIWWMSITTRGSMIDRIWEYDRVSTEGMLKTIRRSSTTDRRKCNFGQRISLVEEKQFENASSIPFLNKVLWSCNKTNCSIRTLSQVPFSLPDFCLSNQLVFCVEKCSMSIGSFRYYRISRQHNYWPPIGIMLAICVLPQTCFFKSIGNAIQTPIRLPKRKNHMNRNPKEEKRKWWHGPVVNWTAHLCIHHLALPNRRCC